MISLSSPRNRNSLLQRLYLIASVVICPHVSDLGADDPVQLPSDSNTAGQLSVEQRKQALGFQVIAHSVNYPDASTDTHVACYIVELNKSCNSESILLMMCIVHAPIYDASSAASE